VLLFFTETTGYKTKYKKSYYILDKQMNDRSQCMLFYKTKQNTSLFASYIMRPNSDNRNESAQMIT